jgi:hypothetical protein
VKFDLAVADPGCPLICAITPGVTPAPVCTVPASVSVSQDTAAAMTAKISTTAASGASGSISQANLPTGRMPIIWTIVVLALGLMFTGYRRRMPALAIPMIVVVLLGLAACGGGGGGSSSMKAAGTPAGTYTANVTAKSGSLSHSTTVTVIVQ